MVVVVVVVVVGVALWTHLRLLLPMEAVTELIITIMVERTFQSGSVE
jgi:hypothetical protein